MKNNISILKDFIFKKRDGIFLYNWLNNKSYLFIEPIYTFKLFNPKNISHFLDKLDYFFNKNFYIAGYINFESGYFLWKHFYNKKINFEKPLIHFKIFESPYIYTNLNLKRIITSTDDFSVTNIIPNITYNEYKSTLDKIKHNINNGEYYQINFCFKLKFNFKGNPFSLFYKLFQNQPVNYAAYIKDKNTHILSLSPELFFHIENNIITLKPMKGTLLKTPHKCPKKFLLDVKNKAENIMIVDLIRNDISKICKTGTVTVPFLFSIEKYKTLYQLTSTIKGELKKNVSLKDIIYSIFPSGSVTGAPKFRVLNEVLNVEKEPRGIYTGAIGFFHKKKSIFNIPIRTLSINTHLNKGEMGIGSGIVYDSKPYSEFKESMGKANFFSLEEKEFALIETILLENKRFFLLSYHLNRLKNSALFFKFPFNKSKIMKELYNIKNMSGKGRYKIKLFLHPNGKIKIKKNKIFNMVFYNRICISKHKVFSKNIFLNHKTTNRNFFDKEYKRYSQNKFDDVIFLNEKNEITQGSITNIFIKYNNKFFTPPINSGVLPGVYREYFLKKVNGKEKKLFLQDLLDANEIFLCNSIRKIWSVKLIV